jgi:hypothetical protein
MNRMAIPRETIEMQAKKSPAPPGVREALGRTTIRCESVVSLLAIIGNRFPLSLRHYPAFSCFYPVVFDIDFSAYYLISTDFAAPRQAATN